MIKLKSPRELDTMRRAGKIVHDTGVLRGRRDWDHNHDHCHGHDDHRDHGRGRR